MTDDDREEPRESTEDPGGGNDNSDGESENTEAKEDGSGVDFLESVNSRNVGKWVAEAYVADRVVGAVNHTYERTKRATNSILFEEREEYADLSEGTDFPGTRFNIFPFDGTHTMWPEKIERRVRGKTIQGPPRDLSELIAKGEIPRVTVDSFKLRWVRDERHADGEILYTEQNTDQINVILPTSGRFWAIGKRNGRKGELWADHLKDGAWHVQYSRADLAGDEPYNWYVPVPRVGEIDGTRIEWFD